MLHRIEGNDIEPMPESQFYSIVEGFRRQGGEIRTDEETQSYLDFRGAEGITLNQNLIFLRANPSRSAVFEELIHATQFKDGEIKELPRDMILGEINAKTKLIRYKDWYNLTEDEVENTKRALQDCKEELKLLEERENGL